MSQKESHHNIPSKETKRNHTRDSYNILDTLPEPQFDRITRLAASICKAPIALVSLIDNDRQWFKSKFGLNITETPFNISFCQYALMDRKIFEVCDAAQDERFVNNPLVTGELKIRYYAGHPLIMPDGNTIGTLCILDRIPGKLDDNQKESLRLLAEEVVHNIIARKERSELNDLKNLIQTRNNELERSTTLLNDAQRIAKLGAWELELATGKTFWTEEVYSIHELEKEYDHNKTNGIEFYHPDDRIIISQAIEETIKKQISFDVKCRFITAKGNHRWVRSSGYPVITDGKVSHLIGMFQDITEHKNVELAIIESKDNYEQLVSHIPIGIYKVTENFEFIYVSPVWCKILGISPDAPIPEGSQVLKLVHPDDLDRAIRATQYAIKNKDKFDQELRHIINGELRWLHLVSYPYQHNGNWEWFGTVNDVTERAQAQIELQQNRTRYASIVKALPDLIFRFNSEGIFLDYNSNDVNLLAMPPEVFLGKSVIEIFPDGLGVMALEKIKETLNTNQLVKFEYSLIQNSSSRYWEARIVKSNENEVLLITRDITSEALIQRELEKIKNFLAQTNQVARVGGWEHNLITGEIIWTDTIRQIHEVDPDYVPTYEQVLSFYTPESRKTLRKTIETALVDGKPYNLELQITTGKGRRLWVRGIGNAEFRNGVCIRLYGTFQDINDQKILVDQLNRNESMLKAISESTAELLANPNTKIPLQNSLSRIGKSLSADQSYYISMNYLGDEITCSLEYECYADDRPDAFFIPNLQNLPIHFFKEAMDDLTNGRSYQRFVTSISSESPMREVLEQQKIKSLVLVPIILHGTLKGIIGFDDLYKERIWTQQEITLLHSFADSLAASIERSELEENLKHAKELAENASHSKSEFLANMSHEIRTPLNSVIGFSELLMQTEINENQRQYMQAIHQSGKNLLDIINDILDFSKIEAGKMELSLESTNIRGLIQQIVDMFSLQTNQKHINLKINISSQIPKYVILDPIRIRQVLINLIGNAVKFTEKGKIEFELELLHEMSESKLQVFLFSVRDTGIGISPNKQTNIFEAFSQADGSTTRNYGGTGLGLTITNKLLSLMDSQLELESDLGKGSRFYFKIALSIDDRNNIVPVPSVHKVPEQIDLLKGKFKVLIVDDNPVNRLLAKIMVLNIAQEAKIIEAENGESAIISYRENNPDLILMDVQMPVMSGYEASAKIREFERNSENRIPIVALTAGTGKEERDRCIIAGMDDYLSKPMNLTKLNEILRRWLLENRSIN